MKASGSKRKQSADGLCEASSEASKPGEGGGLCRFKRKRIGSDERAHERNGATWHSCSRRVVSLGACRGRRGTCDEREGRAAAKKEVPVKSPRPMKSLESRRLCAAKPTASTRCRVAQMRSVLTKPSAKTRCVTTSLGSHSLSPFCCCEASERAA